MSHAAFLGAIRAAPDDDTARLVYADYLDEQGGPGDTARAEFIRVQVRLAALDQTHPERPALEDRENELLRAHERAWMGAFTAPLARALQRWRFERGFLGTVQIGTRVLARNGKALFQSHPVSRVRLLDFDSAPQSALAKCPWWAQVRDLDAGRSAVAFARLDALLRAPYLTGLRKLQITVNGDLGPDPLLPDLLANCASLPHLEELHVRDRRRDPSELLPALEASRVRTLRLSQSDLTPEGLEVLLSSDFAARGASVHLEDAHLGPNLWPAFGGKKARPAVTQMRFGSRSRPANLDLPTLLSAPAAVNLTVLDLNETKLSAANVLEIAKSGFLARATELGLTRCTVSSRVMSALAKQRAPHLRKLALGETGLKNAGAFALCDAEWADALTDLDLMRNRLDDDALVAMASSGRFTNLRALDLRVNSPDLGDGCRGEIGDRGVIAMANAPNFARLRHLNLYRTRVTARGIEALLNSPHCRLAELELGGYDLGPDLPAVLARSPGLARLTKLSLSFTPTLGDNALMPVAESPHLSPLCELDVRYNHPGARATAALAARLGRRLES